MSSVSIIMPAYNAEQFICDAIMSVQSQTFVDWQLIVVDDGSTDATSKIVADLASQDQRIHLVRQANSGSPAAARNAGIAVATGRYLSFLDADDRYESDRLAAVLKVFERYSGLGFVFSDMYIEDGEGERAAKTYLGQAGFFERVAPYVIERDGNAWLLNDRYFVFMALAFAAVHTNSVMIDTCVVRSIVPLEFREDLVICEDTELWMRLARLFPGACLGIPLCTYRIHGSGITARSNTFLECTIRLHEENRAAITDDLVVEERAAYARKIARYRRQLAYLWLCQGENRWARAEYVRVRASGERALSDWVSIGKTWLPWRRIRSWLGL